MTEYYIAKSVEKQHIIKQAVYSTKTGWDKVTREFLIKNPIKNFNITTTYSRLGRAVSIGKAAGGVLAGAGAVVSGIEHANGTIGGGEFGLDLVMTGVGLAFPGVGTAVSVGYFIGKAVIIEANGGERPW